MEKKTNVMWSADTRDFYSLQWFFLCSAGQHATLQAGDGPGNGGQGHHDESTGPQGEGSEAAQQKRCRQKVLQAKAQRAGVRDGLFVDDSGCQLISDGARKSWSEFGAMIRCIQSHTPSLHAFGPAERM